MRRKTAWFVAAILLSAVSAAAQRGEPVRQEPPVPTGAPVNSAANPYRMVPGWYQWPQGRAKGSIPAVAVGKNDHIWIIERCGITGFILQRAQIPNSIRSSNSINPEKSCTTGAAECSSFLMASVLTLTGMSG